MIIRNIITKILCQALLIQFFLATACNTTPSSNNPLGVLNRSVNIEMIDTVSKGVVRLSWSDFRQKYRNVSIVYLQDGCARYLGIAPAGRELVWLCQPRFSVRYSVFSIQYSVFSIRCSVFSIQYSVFGIQCSVLLPLVASSSSFACLGSVFSIRYSVMYLY